MLLSNLHLDTFKYLSGPSLSSEFSCSPLLDGIPLLNTISSKQSLSMRDLNLQVNLLEGRLDKLRVFLLLHGCIFSLMHPNPVKPL